MPQTPSLNSFRRTVVKVGAGLVDAAAGGLLYALATIVAVLALGIGSMPAGAQPAKQSCQEVCARRCAQKELAPGLYRMECEMHCVPICYANRENKSAARQGPKSRR